MGGSSDSSRRELNGLFVEILDGGLCDCLGDAVLLGVIHGPSDVSVSLWGLMVICLRRFSSCCVVVCDWVRVFSMLRRSDCLALFLSSLRRSCLSTAMLRLVCICCAWSFSRSSVWRLLMDCCIELMNLSVNPLVRLVCSVMFLCAFGVLMAVVFCSEMGRCVLAGTVFPFWEFEIWRFSGGMPEGYSIVVVSGLDFWIVLTLISWPWSICGMGDVVSVVS